MKLTDKINAFNVDRMEFMRSVEDNYYSLALVDPPYGIGEDGKSNHSRGKLTKSKKYSIKDWDNKPPSVEYFKELQRVSKNQIIFGANHFIENIPNANSSSWIVWDKENGEIHFADCELALTSFDSAVRKFTFKWQGMLQGDMKNKEIRIHPTQKPVALYKLILDKYAKEGNKILDTHGGSMSIGIACHDYGFELDICELDKEYFDNGTNRILNHAAQLRMF